MPLTPYISSKMHAIEVYAILSCFELSTSLHPVLTLKSLEIREAPKKKIAKFGYGNSHSPTLRVSHLLGAGTVSKINISNAAPPFTKSSLTSRITAARDDRGGVKETHLISIFLPNFQITNFWALRPTEAQSRTGLRGKNPPSSCVLEQQRAQ
ncbi:hypothetical protein HYALB_00005298 [Hymenoscyphus albidus]|uniref:Uncharacterized protein n=1 Tax=Hymenoscyphus albidus TaxID=595503 RepID=A0A9N9L9E8_9HELO|nr:hypothetical protein HYALB_00005298 [Hymenoscyphus albidus]